MAAQFKRNYTSNKSSSFVKIILFGLIFVVMIISLYKTIDQYALSTDQSIMSEGTSVVLVDSNHLEIIDHIYFQLGYSEDHEQALWVSYELTKEQLLLPNVDRTDFFTEDPNVSTRSAHHRDYTRSGYSRGHLVPAADMAFSKESMARSFHMSNISPQLSAFNGGIWRELEELCRDWTFENESLYIVSGPIFLDQEVRKIGKSSKVSVPSHFYKVILTKDWDGIAFIIPHRMCTESVMRFSVSIDSVERITGLEFFDNLLDDEIEMVAESGFDSELWRVDDSRYDKRIKNWNNR
jgi:endonuclease G